MTKTRPPRDPGSGSFGGGQSGGGDYANPHFVSEGETPADDGGGDRDQIGGQSHQGYYGGGQAGADNRSGDDHHAASRSSAASDPGRSYRDHPSQRPDPAGEAEAPGDVDAGRTGPVTGKP